jgi:PadR family transcriptional regulator, regulatory protein PadR
VRRSSPRPATLSAKEQVVLELLAADAPMYGLQLVHASNRRLKRGTVYVTLGRMEEKGYVESEPDPAASDDLVLPRRLYRPTAYGLRVLGAWELLARTLQWEGSR